MYLVAISLKYDIIIFSERGIQGNGAVGIVIVGPDPHRVVAVVMDMHSLTVERSDWYASVQDLNDNFMHKYDITLVVE